MTYTHCLSLYIDIKATTREEADQKFADMNFSFTDSRSGDPYDYNFESFDVLTYPEEPIEVPLIEPIEPPRALPDADAIKMNPVS